MNVPKKKTKKTTTHARARVRVAAVRIEGQGPAAFEALEAFVKGGMNAQSAVDALTKKRTI
jgi:hypothetical protein